MGRRKRRNFTPEYKAEVVKLVRTSGKSIGAGVQRAGADRDSRAGLGEASGDRREEGSARAADERGARRGDAAAARAADGDDGTGLPPKSCSLLRQERK